MVALVLAVALGSVGPGQAQPAGLASLPEGADEAGNAQRLVLPAPPPAVVTLDPSDATGSVARIDPFPVPAPTADQHNPAVIVAHCAPSPDGDTEQPFLSPW